MYQMTTTPSERGPITACDDRPSARRMRHMTVGSAYTGGIEVSDTTRQVARAIPPPECFFFLQTTGRRRGKIVVGKTKVVVTGTRRLTVCLAERRPGGRAAGEREALQTGVLTKAESKLRAHGVLALDRAGVDGALPGNRVRTPP